MSLNFSENFPKSFVFFESAFADATLSMSARFPLFYKRCYFLNGIKQFYEAVSTNPLVPMGYTGSIRPGNLDQFKPEPFICIANR
jgi:hypothetical protein